VAGENTFRSLGRFVHCGGDAVQGLNGMISVVLYGRNDSHGYNLHKRGAISLNCIAEVLNDADDEIIFVDYNSPDQIPTFPEAIADTLTDKAVRLLRIIRVREGYHRQFTGETHLVALESQSRNIGIRRINTANRWILSTNTDMIFLPRGQNSSLNDCISALEDGFYHLPRFEIPENLWELFDRRDAAATIAKVAEWGTKLHLNEIVYGGYDNVFEAPGDFQLFLRDDLERIGGFDEAMIRGWHVDSNIARRMKLLRGEVLSAADHVFGYHCGHTRQPTSLHRSGFVANSMDTFVRDVTDPVLHHQLNTWGAPDVVFEERRLRMPGSARSDVALLKAIPQSGPETSEVAMNEGSFDATGYEPSHVLPHLVNLLGELPPGQTVLMAGEDRQLFAQLADAFAALDLGAKILWAGGENGCRFAEPVMLGDGITRADLFVLQFPAYQGGEPDSWKTGRWQGQHALEQIIAAERLHQQADRRLVVLVNAAHTLLQNTFQSAITFTAIPYTARLRHGFVTLPPPPTPTPTGIKHRLRDFHADDIAMVRQLAGQADASPGWERLALDLPDMVAQAELDPASPDAARILEAAERHVLASSARCVEPPVSTMARDVLASRLCSARDWEAPEWLGVAERCFSGNTVYAQGARTRWTWERISLLHHLRCEVDENARPWVLVVANGPESFPAQVAHYGYRVAYISYANLVSGLAENQAGWQEPLKVWHMINHADIIPLDAALARKVGRFDAVLIAGTEISGGGAERFKAVAARIAELASDAAFISFSVQVHINKGRGKALSFKEWQAANQPGGVIAQMGLKPAGACDTRIPLDCAVRFAHEDQSQYVSGLSFGWGDSMVTIGVLNARRAGAIAPLLTAPLVASQDSDSPFPAAVMDEVRFAANQNFACRVICGLSRDLSGFARKIVTDDGLEWHVLALQLADSPRTTIRLGAAAVHLALVGHDGSVSFATSDKPDALEYFLAPALPGDLRHTMVYAALAGGTVKIEVA
jgi:GT2 family glycosyltransferase